MSEYRAWLDRRADELQRQAAALAEAETRWSWGRLLVFVVAIGLTIAVAAVSVPSAVLIGVAGLIGFGVTLRRHQGLLVRHDLADRELQAVRESLRREGGQVVAVRSTARPGDAPVAVAPSGPSVRSSSIGFT